MSEWIEIRLMGNTAMTKIEALQTELCEGLKNVSGENGEVSQALLARYFANEEFQICINNYSSGGILCAILLKHRKNWVFNLFVRQVFR
jgi:hypothetical protein